MIRLGMEQGSPEWVQSRLGIPTSSQFERIITSKTLKVSAQSAGYRNELLAEYYLGVPVSNAGSGFMDRGTDLEREAYGWYEMDRDVDVDRVGFCLTDGGHVGCSPDGLIGSDGYLELKCPSATVHIGYLLDPSRLYDTYRHQVQGGLWVTGRQWVDLVSYHPTLPPVVTRHEVDEEYHVPLGAALADFCGGLALARLQLEKDFGLVKSPHVIDHVRAA